MLGVLAIFGLLTFIAIACYTKIMYKYKSHRQNEQIYMLFDTVYTHLKSIRKIDTEGNITDVFIKLGEIPQDMIKKGINTNIYDSFGTAYYVHRRKASNFEYVAVFMNAPKPGSCINTFKVARQLSERISYINHAVNGAGKWYYGDSNCNGTTQPCLKDVTDAAIDADCENLTSVVRFGIDDIKYY